MKRLYVSLMMQMVSRGLASASRVDGEMQELLGVLPKGFCIQMKVHPFGPQMTVRANGDGTVSRVAVSARKPDLCIRFKHLAHAFSVLSFQEGTARAFANDRMVADGDVAIATRLVRCLNRMESLILPAPVARLAVKRYRKIPLFTKLMLALRIYASMPFQAEAKV